MSTVASAPVPSASILAKEFLACVASPTWPLEPTQMAPDSLTIGIRAAASPPAIGSSGCARATRLETTTTFTMTPHLFRTYREPVWARFVPLIVRCSENACDFKTKPFTPVMWNFRLSPAQTFGPLCCSAVGAAVQRKYGLVPSRELFSPARFTGLTLRLRGGGGV